MQKVKFRMKNMRETSGSSVNTVRQLSNFRQEYRMSAITSSDFEDWLHQYGQVWECGDAESVIRLFTDDANYYETPVDKPMNGHDSVRRYWGEWWHRTKREEDA